MKKSDLKKFKPDSPEYVVLHAKWRKSRGKNPSMTLGHERNPRRALARAECLAYFPVNGIYLQGVSLAKYFCHSCGANGVKLWRPYSSSDVNLLCAECAAEDQEKDISTIDAAGLRLNESGNWTDQIGWYIPAVLSERTTKLRNIYWGYLAVPGSGADWWKALPALAPKKEKE